MARPSIERRATALAKRAEKSRDKATSEAETGTDYSQYRDDPVGFMRDALGMESATLRSDGTAYQAAILRDLAAHDQIALVCGHGVGKSRIDAVAALWWLLTRPFGQVGIVAPTFGRQVRGVLLKEIRKLALRAPEPLPIEIQADRVLRQGFDAEWSIVGLPATEPSRIEGLHAEGGVLLILDESKGIPKEVFDALMGALTGEADNRLLVTSTPGPPSGFLFDIATKHRADWRVHQIPSSDSSLVSPAWVEGRKKHWGEGSPIYKARVLGEFPEESEGTLYPLSDLEAAVGRQFPEPELPPEGRAGLDPAEYGEDRSVVAVFRNKVLVTLKAHGGKLDPLEVASWAAAHLLRDRVKRVAVDSTGIGSGTRARLDELGFRADRFMAGESAKDSRLFARANAEAAWKLREALLRGDVAFDADLDQLDQLLAELSAYKYGYEPSGKIKLDKQETKKSLGHSPDFADAVILAHWAATDSMGSRAHTGHFVW